MVIELSQITQFIGDFLLAFMRISGLFISMVGISSQTIPTTIRVLLSVVLTLMIIPIIPPVPVEEIVNLGTFVLAIKQLIIGLAIGFISTMVINTFVLAGQIIAMQTGLGFASLVDPVNGISVPAVGQFYLILATLLFWGFDGHLIMIQMIVTSFEAFPIAGDWWGADSFKKIGQWAGWMFVAALTISLAPIISLLVVNLAFGVMTKAAPQLNIFSIGFTIAQIMGLVVIWMTLSNQTHHYTLQWQRAQELICSLLRTCV